MSIVWRISAAVAAAGLAASLSASAPAVGSASFPAAGRPQPALYLALGDSVAAGVGAQPQENGYVPVLHQALTAARNCGAGQALGCRLDLLNLAEPGATTTSLIHGQPGQPSQLAEAVALLQARESTPTPVDDVRLVTLDIGGNDVYFPVLQACRTDPTSADCRGAIAIQLRLVQANYDLILSRLRSAADSGTTIAVMTYYNPLPACDLAPLTDLAWLVLEGDGAIGLNDIIRAAAAQHGAIVVETPEIIDATDLVNDCLHPNTSGHGKIAAAFADAVTDEVVGPPGPR